MKYMGSKNRIAKYILPIMLSEKKEDQWWVEPFVGGANMIDKVKGKRIGSDLNKYVIALLNKMEEEDFINNLFHIGEDEYKEIQRNKEIYPDWLVGYVGFNLSFGAKFFGGYRRDKAGIRDYQNEAQQNLRAQQNLIKDVIFVNCDYRELKIPNTSFIYCDPPYENTTKYKNKFNHIEFWDWCRNKSKEGHIIFISEYKAPDDFECLWQKEIVSSLTKNTGEKKGMEKLFRYNKKYK